MLSLGASGVGGLGLVLHRATTYGRLVFGLWQDSSGNGYTSGTVTGVTFNSYSATMLGTNNGFQLNSAFVTAFKTLTEFTIMCFVSASNVSAWFYMQYANIRLWLT